MDPGTVQIIVAVLGSSTLPALVKVISTRWQKASGRKKQIETEMFQWKELALRYRLIAIEHGVPVSALGEFPDI